MQAQAPGLACPLSFPFGRAHPLEPPGLYRRLREERPVAQVRLEDGTEAFVVTRYADVARVLRDHRFSREAVSRAARGELVAGTAHLQHTLETVPDADDHSTPYGVVLAALSPRAVARYEPFTRQVVEHLLDAMQRAGPPADLIDCLARPLPAAGMGRLLGIPEPDRAWFQCLSSSTVVFCATERSRSAMEELTGYVGRLLAAKRHTPGRDLCSSLLAAHDRDPRQLPWEAAVRVVLRVAAAGLHSVVVSLGKGLPLLLRQPQLYAELGAQGDGHRASQLVEELLRIAAPAPTALPRVAVQDVELGGVRIARGSIVLASLESANHDEEHYPKAGRLCLERGGSPHTSFGMGANYCVGAALARMELKTALTALARRLPALALDVPDGRLRLDATGIAPQVLQVPVSW